MSLLGIISSIKNLDFHGNIKADRRLIIININPTIIIMKLASYTLPKEGPKTI